MNLNDQEKAVVRYWWDMSKQSMASAKREYEAEAYIFAINRLYYALFYAVSAVFMERQQTFKKHTGVRAAFHRELVKSGLIDTQWAKLYDQLFEDRQEGDYIAMMAFDQDYVKEKLQLCQQLLDVLGSLLKTKEDKPE